MNVKQKSHALEVLSRRLAVFFEIQVWQISIKLQYQNFLIENLKLWSILIELIWLI